MLQLLVMLDSRIVVTMGPCEFIPVRLSIFRPDLGTSVPLYKLSRGKYSQSLCPGSVSRFDQTVIFWIAGSVWFTVWVLNGFMIPIESFTDPPISVGNKTLSSVTAIRFLVILLPSGGVSRFVTSTRLSRYALNSIVLLAFCSIVSLAISSILLLASFYS